MQILFAISILSFLALVWAAIAITRRVRTSHELEGVSTPSQPDFSQFLFAAAKGENDHPSHPVTEAPSNAPANSYDQVISPKRL